QAYNAALAKGSNPTDLVSATVLSRVNNPVQAGNPFQACPRCAAIQNGTGVFNATDAEIGHTHTSDTTVPEAHSPGFTQELGKVGTGG
ncbi:MAG TPA: hypothetical protein VFF73_19305, partial [Planctomycetota bacterium]|nr:hypothetical protein [Planctomycetota bacterium]